MKNSKKSSDSASKIAFWTLGCSKNTYDSEQLMSKINQEGYQVVDLKEKPDVVILNTCGFIEEAKEQSIEAILECCAWKKENKIEKVVAMGCLTQRYKEEITQNIPELDGVFGVDQFDQMLDFCKRELKSDESLKCNTDVNLKLTLTPGHWSYVKVSDGCSNGCSFCAIPTMKGLLKDRAVSDILEEIKRKLERGVKEFIIIGQDPTHFGNDATGATFLNLLQQICKIEGDFWVRVLYAFPGHLSTDILDFISENPKMVKYIDMPIQHANTYMLKRMGRATTQKKILQIMKHAWSKTPRIHIRSTAIVGFPGETDEHFQDMIDFICEYKFDRLGAFAYSAEEGTPAAKFADQVDAETINERLAKFEEVQQQITEELSMARIGSFAIVIIDLKRADIGSNIFEARSQAEAPEVDIVIMVESKEAKIGDWCEVKITGYENGELVAIDKRLL